MLGYRASHQSVITKRHFCDAAMALQEAGSTVMLSGHRSRVSDSTRASDNTHVLESIMCPIVIRSTFDRKALRTHLLPAPYAAAIRRSDRVGRAAPRSRSTRSCSSSCGVPPHAFPMLAHPCVALRLRTDLPSLDDCSDLGPSILSLK